MPRLPVAFDTLNLNAALRNGRAQLDWLIHLTPTTVSFERQGPDYRSAGTA